MIRSDHRHDCAEDDGSCVSCGTDGLAVCAHAAFMDTYTNAASHEPIDTTGRGRRSGRRRRARIGVLVAVCSTVAVGSWLGTVAEASGHRSAPSHADVNVADPVTTLPQGPILIVGDSLVVQSTEALRSLNAPGTRIVAAGGSGSAPCDWEHGYTDPFTGLFLRFSDVFDASKPAAVVFAFSGNPGVDFPQTGCVDSSGNYSLATLLASYRRSITIMADYASSHGAQVVLSAVPPRNPATPLGAYEGTGGTPQYGFNGDPALNVLYQQMTRSGDGQRFRWAYDHTAAASVSTPSLSWRSSSACVSGTTGCQNGIVTLREGGLDAIHLSFSGEVRFAKGLIEEAMRKNSGHLPL